MSELYCDICGNGPVRAQILLEGAKLLACGRCMKSGKILHRFVDEEPGSEQLHAAPSKMESEEEIVENYSDRIKSAREKMGLPLAVVAERINEKESYLHAIENKRMMPTMDVARKLEKELAIKLIEKTEASVSPTLPSGKSFSEPTLGDMLFEKKKKEK